MEKARARPATSVPMAPSPTIPRVRPSRPPSWALFQGSTGPVIHDRGSCFSKASMVASTNSAMAGAAAPLEQVSTWPSRAPKGNPSAPAPRMWIQRMAGPSAPARAGASSNRVTNTSARSRASGLSAMTTSVPGSNSRRPSATNSPNRPR